MRKYACGCFLRLSQFPSCASNESLVCSFAVCKDHRNAREIKLSFRFKVHFGRNKFDSNFIIMELNKSCFICDTMDSQHSLCLQWYWPISLGTFKWCVRTANSVKTGGKWWPMTYFAKKNCVAHENACRDSKSLRNIFECCALSLSRSHFGPHMSGRWLSTTHELRFAENRLPY